MLLTESTWPEIDAYLRRSSGVVIPTGSTEQHGPIGLIGTDAICAEAVAQGVAARHDVLVGPTLALGVAQFNLGFAGTVSVRATTYMALVEDYVRSLARHGFTRFYFLNGHGGNIAPLRALFQDLYASYSLTATAAPLRFRLRSWWEYPAADRLRKALYGDGEGMHGTPSEVAITQHVVAQSARSSVHGAPLRLSSEFMREHAGDNHLDAGAHRAQFPDGRVGSDSALARPEDGARLLEAAVTDAWHDYQAFRAEPL